MELSPGVIVGGNYQIEALVGTGGMGSVWRAKDLQLGRPVALKILHTNLRDDPSLNERFQREARLLASIEHPSIVPIYTWLTIEDNQGQSFPCIVMQLVKGSPLADVMKKFGGMKLEHAVNICRLLLDALSVAHESGIIHRDLKPQNMVLEERASLTQLRLLDFGIARSISAKPSASSMLANQAGMLLGTPEYMSPEQISNPSQADSRADLWAAAVCFFEMLTGRLPFEGENRVEVVTKVLSRPPTSARTFVPGLPRSIDDFFGRAFARELERRPRTAAEMIKMLGPLDIGKDRTVPFMWPPPADLGATGVGAAIAKLGTAPTSAPGVPLNSDDQSFGATSAIPLVSQAQVMAYKAASAGSAVGAPTPKPQFLATRPSGTNVPSQAAVAAAQAGMQSAASTQGGLPKDRGDALARTRAHTPDPQPVPQNYAQPQSAWQPQQPPATPPASGQHGSYAPANAQLWSPQSHPMMQQQQPPQATPRPWVMDGSAPYAGAPQQLPPAGMNYGVQLGQQAYPQSAEMVAPVVRSRRGGLITAVLSIMILLIAGGVVFLVLTSR